MRRLLKYLKPYILFIILTIGLLFVQANADLALPDYLSRIVNNGIQQNGVENALASAIRETEFKKLILFMDQESVEMAREAYLLIQPDDPEAADYLGDYPVLADQAVYILQDPGQEAADKLNQALGKAFIAVSGIQGMIDDPSRATMFGEGFEFDPSRIPPGMDVFQALGMMPADMRAEMFVFGC